MRNTIKRTIMRLYLIMNRFLFSYLKPPDLYILNKKSLAFLKWLECLKKPEIESPDPDEASIDYYLQYYTLEDVALKSDELKDDKDREIRDSMLLLTYLNLSACYLKLNHYKEANKALKSAGEVITMSSQVLFRRSQALGFNKGSSLDDLNEARNLINEALKVMKTEGIFQEKFKGLLHRLELDDIEDIYRKQYEFIKEREAEVLRTERIYIECKRKMKKKSFIF